MFHLNEEEGSVMELQGPPNCFKQKGNDLFSIAPGDMIKNNGIKTSSKADLDQTPGKIPVVKSVA